MYMSIHRTKNVEIGKIEKTGRTFIIKPTQKAFAICKIIGEVEQIIPMKKL